MDRKLERETTERRLVRRALVRGADRNDKVRTYNWAQVSRFLVVSLSSSPAPTFQGRVTDHRINLTISNLHSVLEGDGLDLIIDALKRNHDEAVMEELEG